MWDMESNLQPKKSQNDPFLASISVKWWKERFYQEMSVPLRIEHAAV